MKIVFLMQGFFDEVEYQENLLLKYYEMFGHEVHVITSTNTSILDFVTDRHDKGAGERTYSLGAATIYRLRHTINLFHRLYRFPDITPILEEIKPDLIFAHNLMLNTSECVRYVRRHPECKMILDYHGDYSNTGTNWLSLKILHRVILKRVLDQARPHLSRIFPITPASEKFLNAVYGVPHAEMEVLPLGADMEAVRRIRASGARETLRERYKITPDTVVIFTGGKLIPIRQTEILIDAVKKLSQHKVHLVIVGEAPAKHKAYKAMLKERVDGRGNIQFVGWLSPEEIYRHYALSDIAVFPAAQSILWQQAISMGLPLVVGDLAKGLQDVSYLNFHGNILIADQTQPLEVAILAMVETLIEDESLRKKMAAGADQVAAELLDWNVLIHRTLRFNAPNRSNS